jgi:hypothetical protein
MAMTKKSYQQLKQISGLINVLAFVCAVALLTNYTYGFIGLLKLGFYAFGFGSLIIGFILAKNDPDKSNLINPLFWIGICLLFLGLIIRINLWPYSTFVILPGALFSGLSYFFNPNKGHKPDSDDLLDS